MADLLAELRNNSASVQEFIAEMLSELDGAEGVEAKIYLPIFQSLYKRFQETGEWNVVQSLVVLEVIGSWYAQPKEFGGHSEYQTHLLFQLREIKPKKWPWVIHYLTETVVALRKHICGTTKGGSRIKSNMLRGTMSAIAATTLKKFGVEGPVALSITTMTMFVITDSMTTGFCKSTDEEVIRAVVEKITGVPSVVVPKPKKAVTKAAKKSVKKSVKKVVKELTVKDPEVIETEQAGEDLQSDAEPK